MTPADFQTLVAQARLAPSVHNVQPARWRLTPTSVQLFADRAVTLPAADPTGRDIALSLGAACEGFILAAGQAGWALTLDDTPPPSEDRLQGVRSMSFAAVTVDDPLAEYVDTRRSWRGPFATPTDNDRRAARALEADDCAVVTEPRQIAELAVLVDRAGFGFLRQGPFRAELLSWMRLRRAHARWGRDGLNAEAMQLGAIERLGAALVMGQAFGLLDRLGLAAPLLADVAKTKTAAAIVLLHRAEGEDPFDSGRAFYRAWLRMEAIGFPACVLAALADDPEAADAAATLAKVPKGRKLISAFRIGRVTRDTPVGRARLPVDELIV